MTWPLDSWPHCSSCPLSEPVQEWAHPHFLVHGGGAHAMETFYRRAKSQPQSECFRGHALYRLKKWKLEQLPQPVFLMRPFTELLGLVTLSWTHTGRRLTQPNHVSNVAPTLDSYKENWIEVERGAFYSYNPISVRFASLIQFVDSSKIRIWLTVILARDSPWTEANTYHS